MHKAFAALASLVLLANSALASSVTVHADNNVGISYGADPVVAAQNPAIASNTALKTAVTNGDDMLAGNAVLIGTYNLSDAVLSANKNDLNFLLSNFTLYGDTTNYAKIGDGFGGTSGVLQKQVVGTSDPLFSDKQIYVLVLASTDNSSLSKAMSSAFQIGIFYMDKTVDTDWAFKLDSAIPNGSTIDFNDMTNPAGTALATGAHVVVGSFGQDNSNVLTGKNFSLQFIPEPGSTGLALCGGAALLLRRRRRTA